MVSVEGVPICFAGSHTQDISRASPIPGLTGSPSRLIVLAIVERVRAFERSTLYMAASGVDP
jgi:hypothetical protein